MVNTVSPAGLDLTRTTPLVNGVAATSPSSRHRRPAGVPVPVGPVRPYHRPSLYRMPIDTLDLMGGSRTAGGRAQLRADMFAGAAFLGVVSGMLALLGGCVASAFGSAAEAGVVVVGIAAICAVVGAAQFRGWLGAGLGLLLATLIAVVLVISLGGAILLPLVVVPACAAAVGAAIGALRMCAVTDPP